MSGMRKGASGPIWRIIAIAVISLMTGYACSRNSYTGKIIAVAVPDIQAENLAGAGLVVVDPDAPQKGTESISEGFASAASPSLSHDGRFLYFQGKKLERDPWQIWVLDLQKKSFRQVTELPDPCTDPIPLPDETIIFSRESSVGGIAVNDLWRCGADGCCLTRITYNPAQNVDAGILSEGRILYLSSQQYPEIQPPVLMVMRPDGTKSELYTPGCCKWSPVTGGSEFDDGYVYFISEEGRLSRVLHRRPLHTFENLTEGIPGLFASVAPAPDGACLVAYSPGPGVPYGIYTASPEGESHPELIYQGTGDLTEPLWVMEMEERPRKLPSAVNPDIPTGLLMSQNINHSMLPVHPGIQGDTIASRIRVTYLEGNQAVTEVEADGSFYLKMDADMPFRIETLNEAGETVRGPSDWIYLRPNERRACTGCHADPELAPENIQPRAVRSDPLVVSATKNKPGE